MSRSALWLLALVLPACSRPDASPPPVASPFVLADGVLESAADILETAARFELLALEPMPLQQPTATAFGGYEVRGRTEVEVAIGRDVLRLVEEGIRASDGRVAACFNPRHGIRAESAAGTCDIVICYECLSMQVFVDGAHAENVLTSERVEPRVTAIWRTAGLTLAD